MFFRVFLFFALVAAAFAVPNPEPKPQYYTAGVVPAVGYSAYSAYAPVAYSAPAPYAAYPYAYSAYYVK